MTCDGNTGHTGCGLFVSKAWVEFRCLLDYGNGDVWTEI